MKKKETPATQLAREANAAVNKEYYDLLGASSVLDDLVAHFELNSMVKHNTAVKPDGQLFKTSVDSDATLAACGAYEVVSYIKQRIELGRKGQ